MFRRLWVALGFKFPTVSDAMRKRQACTRVGSKSYCAMNRAGFAEAFIHHIQAYDDTGTSLAMYTHLHKDIVARAQTIDYPSVVTFTNDDFSAMAIDPTSKEHEGEST